jgi:hypothetical protein
MQNGKFGCKSMSPIEKSFPMCLGNVYIHRCKSLCAMFYPFPKRDPKLASRQL